MSIVLPSWLQPATSTSYEEHQRERAVFMDWLRFRYYRHRDFGSPHSRDGLNLPPTGPKDPS